MIKTSLICMFFLLTLTASDQYRSELKWKNINSLVFDLPQKQYTTDSIYFYHNLLMRTDNFERVDEESTFSFPIHAQPLDIHEYWEQKGEEQYDVLFTKVAYVLDQPTSFFTKERLSDPAYISQTMPSATLTQNDSTYHISVGFGAPEIDYTLSFYSPEEFESHYPTLSNYFKKYDELTQPPSLTVVQHNYRYGKVMFQETSKMSISISRYFPLNNAQTLAFNYTLIYIQNMPPSYFGGSVFLIDKIKEGTKALIDETQYICRITD